MNFAPAIFIINIPAGWFFYHFAIYTLPDVLKVIAGMKIKTDPQKTLGPLQSRRLCRLFTSPKDSHIHKEIKKQSQNRKDHTRAL